MHQLAPLFHSGYAEYADDAGRSRLFTLLLLMLGILVLPATAAFAEDDADSQVRVQSTLEVRAMKKVRQAIDDVARQQTGFVDNVLKDMADFVVTFEKIGKDVAEMTNAWIEDPSEKRRAQLTRAVSEGAARGQRACEHLAKADAKVGELVGVIRRGLAGHVQEANTLAQGARHRVQEYERQVSEAEKAAFQLREELKERNLLDGGELPLEIEDRLWHLKIDYEDAQVMVELSEGTAVESENFVERLKDVDTDYEAIERMVGRIAYRAKSAQSVFAGIGELEKAGIYNRLIEQAYDSRGLREQMRATFDRMQKMQGVVGALRTATSKRYTRTSARSQAKRTPFDPGDGDLRAWLTNLGRAPQAAPAPSKAVADQAPDTTSTPR